jgi:hypothetical protein
MAFFTKAEARAAAARSTVGRRTATRTYDGILREQVRATAAVARFDIFLSHSINDAELVTGVKALLEEQGLKVYVDWAVDPFLDRTKVSKETAALLRERMRQSNSLIYLATESASSSKWMPWELGYFDGFKPNCVAIMPLLDYAQQQFTGQEYLALYPVVSKESPSILVEDRNARVMSTLRAFGRGAPELHLY